MPLTHEEIFVLAGKVARSKVFDSQAREDRHMDMYVAGVQIQAAHPDIVPNALARAMYRRGVLDVLRHEMRFCPSAHLSIDASDYDDWLYSDESRCIDLADARAMAERALESLSPKRALVLSMKAQGETAEAMSRAIDNTESAARSILWDARMAAKRVLMGAA